MVFNSYNEFMLTNDLVALNTHPNEAGTSNFTRGNMSSLDYSIIKEQETTETTETSETTSPVESKQPVEIPSSISKTDRAIGILNGSIPTKHKGNALFTIFIEKDGKLSDDDKKALKDIKKLKLLPKNIIFDETFDYVLDENGNPVKDKNGNILLKGNNAQSDIETKQVTVGTKWLNLFNKPEQRSYAIRVLIHEQLHIQLHSDDNNKYIKSITDIFNEFENSLNKENVRKFYNYCKQHGISFKDITDNDEGITKLLNNLKQFKYEQYGKDIDRRLEEFLVDSLMNSTLINYLNSIEVKDPIKKTRSNLFKRILKILSDIFGWNIEKNSLREKELYSLRDVLVAPKTTTKKVSKKELSGQPMLPGLFDEEVQTQNNQSKAQDNIQEEVPEATLTK